MKLFFAVLLLLLLSAHCYPAEADAGSFQVPDVRLRAAINEFRESSRARRLTHNEGRDSPPRHASTYLWYKNLPVSVVSSWYNEVKVMSSSSVSFFAVNGHAYGYAGIQQLTEQPFTGRVLFSIWDQLCKGDNAYSCPDEKRVEVTQCGTDVVCKRFGGEGTGAKAMWDWNDWKVDETYGFLTVAAERPDDRVEYTGYFYAGALGGWRILASMIVNRGGKDWNIHGVYSFVEQFTQEEVEDVRWARFGPTLIRGDDLTVTNWAVVTNAEWSHTDATTEDATHIHGNVSVNANKWAMGLGGDLTKGTDRYELLSVTPPSVCPTSLVAFVALEQSSTVPTALPPVVPVCSDVAGASSSEYPCKCGVSSAATKECEDGQMCTASSDSDGVCAAVVTCGGHKAATCAGCPQGNGASWCNGDCTWQSNSCVPKTRRLLERPSRILSDVMLDCSASSSSGSGSSGSGAPPATPPTPPATSPPAQPPSPPATPPPTPPATPPPAQPPAPPTTPPTSPPATPSPPPEDTSVSCGNHNAASCAECPQGNGPTWCNGVCEWSNNQCVDQAATGLPQTPTVSCGSHSAASCAECPQGNGATWCNGVCEWSNGQCVEAMEGILESVAASPTVQRVKAETKLTLDSVPSDFATDPKVKDALQQAIADSMPGIQKEHVTILGIHTGRRLDETPRRLAETVTVQYEITTPETYALGPITAASINADTLKDNVNSNFQSQGVAATVSSAEIVNVVAVPTNQDITSSDLQTGCQLRSRKR